MIEKLDGFTADGYGNVIGTEQDLTDGDVCRIDDKIERRWYAPGPAPVPQPIALTQLGFITLCQEAGGMTDDMLVLCKNDAALAAMWIKFNAAATIEKTDNRIPAALQALEALGYLPNKAKTVLDNWPV